MKKIIIPLLLTLSVSIWAQTESRKDSLHINKDKPLQQFQDLQPPANKKNTSETVAKEEKENSVHEKELKQKLLFVQASEFILPPLYIGPPNPTYEEGKTYKSKLLAFTHDYTFFSENDLGNNVSLQTASLKKTNMGMGAMSLISADLYYQPWDWLTVSGGMYAGKYSMPGMESMMHFNEIGFNASLQFKLHDRVYLRAHGMYSIDSDEKKKYFRPAMRGLYPQTYYGGGVGFKITDKFGVEGGMIRELNPMNGKWQNVPYIMPIFYGTGIGISR